MRHRNNRKKRDGFVLPAPFVSVVVALAAMAMAYLGLYCRCEGMGREIKKLEAEGETLRKQLLCEQYRWTRLKAPENLERTLSALNIVMVWPRREQVVYLADVQPPGPGADEHGRNALTYVRRERNVMDD